jgi:hypothetical protein
MSDEYYCRLGNWPIPRRVKAQTADTDIPLSSMQRKKLKQLIEKGAKVKSAKLMVKTASGNCTIDEFGKVEWMPP